MKAFALLAAALLLTTPTLAAHRPPDPGAHIMKDYVLTMPKLKAYEAAYEALVTAAKADPSLKADIAAASSEQDPTIATPSQKWTITRASTPSSRNRASPRWRPRFCR